MKRISKTEIKEMRSQSKKNRIMFAFTLPTVILYTIFFLVTMLIGVYYSFTDWNGISKDYTFVGLKNYVKVLTDERFREALWFNIGYTIALVVLLIVIPLTIALALNRSKSSRILKILSYVLLITGMIVILYPFYLTIITALKTPQESSQSFFSFPQSFYLGNFVNVLQKANYFVFFRNSAVVTLVSVFLIMVLIPMCSYAIARNMEKRYYKTMYFYLLAGIFVPFQVIMVPLVKYLAKLKLCNIPGLIIMCVTLASSQGVFLLVNYIRSVPRDLEEAAYIDGCGTVKAYVKIVLPMIKPILATIFVLNALWVWNDFQMPLLILNQSQDMWTLPLFQYNFKSQYSFDYNLAFASYLIAMIPVLIAYACAQKHIVSGLTQGAVKS